MLNMHPPNHPPLYPQPDRTPSAARLRLLRSFHPPRPPNLPRPHPNRLDRRRHPASLITDRLLLHRRLKLASSLPREETRCRSRQCCPARRANGPSPRIHPLQRLLPVLPLAEHLRRWFLRYRVRGRAPRLRSRPSCRPRIRLSPRNLRLRTRPPQRRVPRRQHLHRPQQQQRHRQQQHLSHRLRWSDLRTLLYLLRSRARVPTRPHRARHRSPPPLPRPHLLLSRQPQNPRSRTRSRLLLRRGGAPRPRLRTRRLKRSKRKSRSFLVRRSEAQLLQEVGSEPDRDRRTPRVASELELLPLSEEARTGVTPPPAAQRARARARAVARSHGRRRRLNRLNKSSGNESANANANCSTGSQDPRSDRARPDFEVRQHHTSTRPLYSRLRTGSRARKIRIARRGGRRVLRTAKLRLRRRRRVTSGGVPNSVQSPLTAAGSIRLCHRRRRPSLPLRRRKRSQRPRHHPPRPLCLSFPTAINGRRPSDRR
jgi:hypothetical protein